MDKLPSLAKRCTDWAIALGFMVALCLPLLQRPKQIPRLFVGVEPATNSASLLSFRDIDQRFIKRFPRHDLATTYNRMRFTLFGLVPKTVILGDQGWLFYHSEMANDGHTMDDFRGELAPGEATLAAWHGLLRQRQAWLEQRGIRYLVVVAPNKQSIYPEFLPRRDQRRRSPRTLLDELIRTMPASAPWPLMDLREPLRSAKRLGPVYFRTDTHWNDLGASISAQAIAARLRTLFPAIPIMDEELFSTRNVHFSGDIAAMALLAERFSEEAPQLVPRRSLPITYGDGQPVFVAGSAINGANGHFSPGSAGEVLTIEQPDPSLPQAMVFGDSFSLGLAPLLCPYFQRVQVVRGAFDQDLVAREHPQVVIQEVAERYLQRLFGDNP